MYNYSHASSVWYDKVHHLTLSGATLFHSRHDAFVGPKIHLFKSYVYFITDHIVVLSFWVICYIYISVDILRHYQTCLLTFTSKISPFGLTGCKHGNTHTFPLLKTYAIISPNVGWFWLCVTYIGSSMKMGTLRGFHFGGSPSLSHKTFTLGSHAVNRNGSITEMDLASPASRSPDPRKAALYIFGEKSQSRVSSPTCSLNVLQVYQWFKCYKL